MEDGDAEGDYGYDEVFVGFELAAVEDDVHEEDGDEFAGFTEHHGRIGYIAEGGESKGGCAGDEEGTLEEAEEEGDGETRPGLAYEDVDQRRKGAERALTGGDEERRSESVRRLPVSGLEWDTQSLLCNSPQLFKISFSFNI